mmetsp:Transcript_76021/g.165909  ORF Transcript_76021/g.165909 Transcript_76021/m.165909 type:complete len:96 (+) Transcript_76021:225-512(+)
MSKSGVATAKVAAITVAIDMYRSLAAEASFPPTEGATLALHARDLLLSLADEGVGVRRTSAAADLARARRFCVALLLFFPCALPFPARLQKELLP